MRNKFLPPYSANVTNQTKNSTFLRLFDAKSRENHDRKRKSAQFTCNLDTKVHETPCFEREMGQYPVNRSPLL